MEIWVNPACSKCRSAVSMLDEAGAMTEAKARGWVRIEGKDYVMQDGDVVEFRFNV